MKNKKEKTVELHVPDFSEVSGCFTKDDSFTHLGDLSFRITACGKSIEKFGLGRKFTINCPDCVAETEYRSEHSEATKERIGIVTHKRNKGKQ